MKKAKTWKRGSPEHKPTDESRAEVMRYVVIGAPQEDIARVMGMDAKTLRRHYREELDNAKIKANGIVGGRLFAQTKTNPAAAIFWMKSQAGWRETQNINLGGQEGANPLQTQSLPADCTAEEASAAYLELLKGRAKK